MATQRISLAKIGGHAANAIANQFQIWAALRQGEEFPASVQLAVDRFADALRQHSSGPPIVYFSEWIDMWSMGDLIPSLADNRAVTIYGQRFEACCHIPPILLKTTTADKLPQESEWLQRRLAEANDAWSELVPTWVVVALREPIGGSVTDDELKSSLNQTPAWLKALSGE